LRAPNLIKISINLDLKVNMLYHIKIELHEKNQRDTHTIYYEYNKNSLNELISDLLEPYVNKRELHTNGRFIDYKEIRSIAVKESTKTIEEIAGIASTQRRGIQLEITNKMAFHNDTYLKDITNEVIRKITRNDLIEKPKITSNKKVFIVHGHNELLKTQLARFIEKLGLEAIILHEQANQGMTIIEKIEAHTDVGFAIVLYTADDKGNTKVEADKGQLNTRARQNVVFEHGYLIAKLSRARVIPLVEKDVELPSDIKGVVYIDNSHWQIDVAKEMKRMGYDIDFNKILGA
jgi:predicted nucleotide-binding protein